MVLRPAIASPPEVLVALNTAFGGVAAAVSDSGTLRFAVTVGPVGLMMSIVLLVF
jgi:hypothetical protein